jgi:hypothetical protein
VGFNRVFPRALSRTRLMAVVAAFVYLTSAGCTSFKEQYFIELEECRPDWGGNTHSSFMKLDLKGNAFFTVSKFEMGWYDGRAVDALFSTIDGQDHSDAAGSSGQSGSPTTVDQETMDCAATPNTKQAWRRTRVYGPNGKVIGDVAGKRLVMFASSNPNNLVNRISTTVNTLAMSEQLAGLLRQEEFGKAAHANLNVDLAGRRHEALALVAQEFLRWVDAHTASTATAEAVKAKLSELSSQVDSTIESK